MNNLKDPGLQEDDSNGAMAAQFLNISESPHENRKNS